MILGGAAPAGRLKRAGEFFFGLLFGAGEISSPTHWAGLFIFILPELIVLNRGGGGVDGVDIHVLTTLPSQETFFQRAKYFLL